MTSGPTPVDTPDGARLAVFEDGQGPDLLLVSGLGGTAGFWAAAVPALARAHRVTRFDQRGIGASRRGTAPCDIDRLARDCLAVMDARGIATTVLVGHSTGGAIGQALARLAPDRLRGLVLSATWLKPSRYMTALFGTRRRLLDLDPVAYAATGTMMGYAPAWLDAHWAAFEAATAHAPTSEEARRVVRERIDALLGFDGAASVAAVRCPVLVLGARDDLIVPAFLQEELAAALPPGRRVVTYEDGGHFFPVTRTPDFTRDLLDFVGSLT
ncbi:Pimeloyl-ACP methyl ester carboxylesterase [Methylobacterium sp. 174MFSha1.1]|uniref:alpha/beta fold hydrolase n=1 Tax=Methylobacterium sp. 174MFSha1.1 TaxID=1502749 RepID=UPI0008EB5367|nr:alpha/beta hydrolase [Methylobacterium sp. 174MFSha1.1]SFU46046.1 Pimeloyl-ACP methyl ester carboxylesterase [Methylobacterium sp. 174MFSha1.1]